MIQCGWCCSGDLSRGFEWNVDLKIKREVSIEEMKESNLVCDCCHEFDEDEVYFEIEEEMTSHGI